MAATECSAPISGETRVQGPPCSLLPGVCVSPPPRGEEPGPASGAEPSACLHLSQSRPYCVSGGDTWAPTVQRERPCSPGPRTGDTEVIVGGRQGRSCFVAPKHLFAQLSLALPRRGAGVVWLSRRGSGRAGEGRRAGVWAGFPPTPNAHAEAPPGDSHLEPRACRERPPGFYLRPHHQARGDRNAAACPERGEQGNPGTNPGKSSKPKSDLGALSRQKYVISSA